MIVVMETKASVRQIGGVLKEIEREGLTPHLSRGDALTQIGCWGSSDEKGLLQRLLDFDGVARAFIASGPYKLAGREFHPEDSVVRVGGLPIGGRKLAVIAGPCAVESHEQLMAVASVLGELGVPFMRGGAYKPRTSPYSYQGMGEQGLELLREVRNRCGVRIVTECLKPGDVELICEYADMAQVGARNMQNFALLQELGKARIPVLLKRGMMNSLEEMLLSAEYILSNGNSQVLLCERGIRTFETTTRNTLDISAVPVLKRLSHLPVVVDPSHAAGDRELVPALALAGIAAGADALIIEIHPNPEEAVSDGPQSLTLDGFRRLYPQLREVARAVGREL
ncbi:MAG: 3-deoxy-7-phosphoheptulonate synthase [Armatimonadetes bacterium]|nr:3-deoxy-7-phosphoheptulonate synthase [Armatimonadota bacterium]